MEAQLSSKLRVKNDDDWKEEETLEFSVILLERPRSMIQLLKVDKSKQLATYLDKSNNVGKMVPAAVVKIKLYVFEVVITRHDHNFLLRGTSWCNMINSYWK